jgi:hypothetical protein
MSKKIPRGLASLSAQFPHVLNLARKGSGTSQMDNAPLFSSLLIFIKRLQGLNFGNLACEQLMQPTT